MTSKQINRNPALGTSFKMEIPGLEEFNYFVQTSELPGLTAMGVDTPFQKINFSVPSNRLEYDPLNVVLLVDEDFKNYESIKNWMDRINDTEPVVNEMKHLNLIITNSNKRAIVTIRFLYAYPTQITSLQFESSIGDAVNLTCPMTFRYQKFEFIRMAQ
jgi:hypothetical protein